MKEWGFPFRWKCINAEHTFAVNKPFQSKCRRYFAYVLIYKAVWTVCVRWTGCNQVSSDENSHTLISHSRETGSGSHRRKFECSLISDLPFSACESVIVRQKRERSSRAPRSAITLNTNKRSVESLGHDPWFKIPLIARTDQFNSVNNASGTSYFRKLPKETWSSLSRRHDPPLQNFNRRPSKIKVNPYLRD